MAKNELKKPTEAIESKGVESIESLNLEGLKKRYEVIKNKVGEKMLENDKTIKRLITEITIGSGKSFKKEKMMELDSLLKMHEENQGLMEKTAESLNASLKEIQKPTATENISTGKFISNEAKVESRQIRFENEIPSALEGVLSLEITNKPPKEVGNNFGTGELHLIPGAVAGQEKLGISVNGKNLEVKEVYENIDGSWTINAGKYEFRTEGPAPKTIETPIEIGISRMEGLAMAEAAKAGSGTEAYEINEPAVKDDLRSRINIGTMRMDGMSDAEIAKNIARMDVEQLKQDKNISQAIESITAKIAKGESIDNELKSLSGYLEIPENNISQIRSTIEALLDADARKRLPKDSALETVKFAGWMGLGFFARGFTSVSALVAARGLDSYLSKKESGKKLETARNQSLQELATEGSKLNEKMKQALVDRLSSVKQEQINHSAENIKLLNNYNLEIVGAKNDSERAKLISEADQKIEAVSENVYSQVYDYYKRNRPDLNDQNLISLAKSAKWEFIKDQQGKRQKAINGVINRKFDERVDTLIDKTVPTFRNMLKGAGLTEDKSALHSAALSVGMGAGLRGLGSFASMHVGAFMGGGVMGEKTGKKLFGKELERVTMAQLQTAESDPTNKKTLQLLGKIESQLNSPDDAIRFPTEHNEMQKWLDNFDQQVLDKMTNDEDRKSFIQNRGTGIEKWLAREKDQHDKIALARWLGRLILAGSATAYFLNQQEMANQVKPAVAEQAPVAPVAEAHAPRLEGHITPGQGITQQMEEMISKGIEDGKITEQNAQAFIEQNNLALEHAHQTGAITDKVYNAIHDKIANATNLHDKLMASNDAWGLDHKDFDMAKTGDTVSINLESGTVEFVNRGDLPVYTEASVIPEPGPILNLPPNPELNVGETTTMNVERYTTTHEIEHPIGTMEIANEYSKRGIHFNSETGVYTNENGDILGQVDPNASVLREYVDDNGHLIVEREIGDTTVTSDFGGRESYVTGTIPLADGIQQLSAEGIKVTGFDKVADELSKRGFSYDPSKHAFIKGEIGALQQGNVPAYQIGEGVKTIELSQNGNDIMIKQVTGTQEILTAIKPDGEAVSKVTERGIFNRIFGS